MRKLLSYYVMSMVVLLAVLSMSACQSTSEEKTESGYEKQVDDDVKDLKTSIENKIEGNDVPQKTETEPKNSSTSKQEEEVKTSTVSYTEANNGTQKTEIELKNSNIEQQNEKDEHSGLYKYAYEYNTETLIQDHYIVMDYENGKLSGRYYGTIDDFVVAREGYLPGYFVLEMQDLIIEGDAISFHLELLENQMFTYPVELSCITWEDVNLDENPMWLNSHMTGKRSYKGKVEDDKIILSMDYNERLFVKMD